MQLNVPKNVNEFTFPCPHRAANWGEEVQLYLFFTSALDKGEWLTSRPSRFTSRARARFPLSRKSIGHQNPSEWLEKRKITFPYRGSIPGRPAPSPVTILTAPS